MGWAGRQESGNYTVGYITKGNKGLSDAMKAAKEQAIKDGKTRQQLTSALGWQGWGAWGGGGCDPLYGEGGL